MKGEIKDGWISGDAGFDCLIAIPISTITRVGRTNAGAAVIYVGKEGTIFSDILYETAVAAVREWARNSSVAGVVARMDRLVAAIPIEALIGSGIPGAETSSAQYPQPEEHAHGDWIPGEMVYFRSGQEDFTGPMHQCVVADWVFDLMDGKSVVDHVTVAPAKEDQSRDDEKAFTLYVQRGGEEL